MPEESNELERATGEIEPASTKAEPESVSERPASSAPPPVPPPGVIPGTSLLPAAPLEGSNEVEAALARLRAEIEASTESGRRARLLYEVGELQEREGGESGAARDYLAAYNEDTSFREPLEGLVRLLERRRSLASLGKLIEAIVAAAATDEERTRAFTQQAIFLEDTQSDSEGARGALREAIEADGGAAGVGAAWLALEIVAAKLGDVSLREEALAARSQNTEDATWRGLLLVDLAELAATQNEIDRALQIAELARGEDAAAWSAACATERILRANPGLPDSAEAQTRTRSLADALESRAEMVREARTSASNGDALGVPLHCRSVVVAADLWLRAAEARRASGELEKAARSLDNALALFKREDAEDSAPSDGGDRDIERIVIDARIRIAEQAGDTALAAELAARRLEDENDRGAAASLLMRVAEHAASEGNITRALIALSTATERDPSSAPPRALKIDILEAGTEPELLAGELEDLAAQYTSKEARGRTLLLAAWVWATRAKNAERARDALGRATDSGLTKELSARFGRTLASLCADNAWYERATFDLIDCAPSDRWLLCVELARLALTRKDEEAAAKATTLLTNMPEGSWLGRLIGGLLTTSASSSEALESLAASVQAPSVRESLSIISVLRDDANGRATASIERLEGMLRERPDDSLVGAYLGDLFRRTGDRAASARIAKEIAKAAEHDPELRAARYLEAGFDSWHVGDKAGAHASFEAAAAAVPDAALPVLAWVTRGVDVDSIDARRKSLALAGADAATSLERFALEASRGDSDDAMSALEAAERSSTQGLRAGAALARLAWARGDESPRAFEAALDLLARTSDEGRAAAAAERFRIAREHASVAADDTVATAAKAWFAAGGGAAAGIELLANAIASGNAEREIEARHALADLLPGDSSEMLKAGAALFDATLRPGEMPPLATGTSHATKLANLEITPPGTDPMRRAAVLVELDGALGSESDLDALALAGWSTLAAGDAEGALDAFATVAAARPGDLYVWEGVRAAAEVAGKRETFAKACEQLGARCSNPSRGAFFWEQAGLAWMDLGSDFEERGEAALEASFDRSPREARSFDRLFRRVRERKDPDKLIFLATKRLETTDDSEEIAKLYWEIARALREKGDPDGALEALEHVAMFDENHVGALALTGEIFIRRGMFAEAAEKLARLAGVEAAPPKNRVTAGIAAVDLYENKLGRHDLALEVLLELHAAKLTTLPVRERLARAAARNGAWFEATQILEELMHERAEREGRIEAARLALVISRERLNSPERASNAAAKLLEESPIDPEAIDALVSMGVPPPARRPLLERSRDALLHRLHEHPNDSENQRRLSHVTQVLEDLVLVQSALACTIALDGYDGSSEVLLSSLTSRKPRLPQVTLTEAMVRQLLAPGDDGPIADLFGVLAPTIAEALGPNLAALGVHPRKDRVDPRAGLALRNEIATWAGAFGIANFDLYVGGRDPHDLCGVPGETPAIIVGSGVNAPLSPLTRSRLARELLAITRGSSIARFRDDTTVAATVVAACKLTKVQVDHPPFAVLAEVERVIGKAISGKTKRAIEPLCRAVVSGRGDARVWAARARASQARAAALASGDVAMVLSDVFGMPIDRVGSVARDDQRAHDLFRFVLSKPYFDLRRALGLEV